MMTSEGNKNGVLTKKDLNKVVFHSLGMEWGWTCYRQMSLAYFNMVYRALKKIYKDQPKKLKEAMKRNLEFFNITPQLAPFVGGIILAMEEENAKNDKFDTKNISNIKTALAGPLSGIGDSFFMTGIRIVALGIGIPLCLQGKFIGIILYFLIYNIPAFYLRFKGINKGYKEGIGYLDKLKNSGVIDKLMEATPIVGIIIVGALSTLSVNTNLILKIKVGQNLVSLQSILNDILPCVVPLLVIWIYYWLLGKKRINITRLIVGTILVCIICAYFNILC